MSLYNRVAEINGDRSWGNVLDAGTGPGSLRWLRTLNCDSITAVTGSPKMREKMGEQLVAPAHMAEYIVIANWADQSLLDGKVYDTVLADYLLGAIDAFAPYWQDQLFHRLHRHVGQRLYVIGLEPYVPVVTDDPAGSLIVEIGRLRDACLLLGRGRPYREYPMEWVIRQLGKSGFRVLDARPYPIRYGEKFVNSQLDMSAAVLNYVKDRALAVALQQHIAELRQRALGACRLLGGLMHGNDYIVVAEPMAMSRYAGAAE